MLSLSGGFSEVSHKTSVYNSLARTPLLSPYVQKRLEMCSNMSMAKAEGRLDIDRQPSLP